MIGFHVLSGAHPFTQTSVKNPSLPDPGKNMQSRSQGFSLLNWVDDPIQKGKALGTRLKNMLTGVERTADGLYPAYSVLRFDTSRGLHFPTRDFSLQLEGKAAQALQQSSPYKLPPPNGRHSRHTVTLIETSLAGRYSTTAKANKMPIPITPWRQQSAQNKYIQQSSNMTTIRVWDE